VPRSAPSRKTPNPFGFAFTRAGTLLVSNVGQVNGTYDYPAGSVPIPQVLSKDGKFAFVTNTLSPRRYLVRPTGSGPAPVGSPPTAWDPQAR
jgi:hypothetical protein